jgi:hypothetical protein
VELAGHVLARHGAASADPLLTKLVAVASQHFIASIIHDSRELGKRRRAQLTQKAFQDMGYDLRDRRLLLMMEDLAWALEEYSVKVAQPAYFADFNSGPAKGMPPS